MVSSFFTTDIVILTENNRNDNIVRVLTVECLQNLEGINGNRKSWIGDSCGIEFNL